MSKHDSAGSEFNDSSSWPARQHAAIDDSVQACISREVVVQLVAGHLSQLHRKDVIFPQRIKPYSIDSVLLHQHSSLIILNHSPISPTRSGSFLRELKEIRRNNFP
jgi:hypothetical protein